MGTHKKVIEQIKVDLLSKDEKIVKKHLSRQEIREMNN